MGLILRRGGEEEEHNRHQASPKDVSLLERCPHFRGCYVQVSMELGPEDVSLKPEKCVDTPGIS